MSYLYQEIAESIRRQIVTGEMKPGDRLPPVRELAKQWRCNPGTVNRAFAELGNEGLIISKRGRGTRVTDNALSGSRPAVHWAGLVNRAEQFLLEALGSGYTVPQAQSALTIAASRWFSLQTQPSPPAMVTDTAGRVRIAGSHDLALELLVQAYQETNREKLVQVKYVGSLGGLMALAQNEADVVGIHLWDAPTASYNLPFVRRVLPGQRLALIVLAGRSLGLMTAKGNPHDLHSLNDLTRPEVSWINRQPGSGTRVWLDDQLLTKGIDASLIQGYEVEVNTHMDLARASAGGQAAAGLGIFAAAAAFDLDFIPLTEEIYQLVVNEAFWAGDFWQELLAIIRSPSFISAVNDLGGYTTDLTGNVTWIGGGSDEARS